MDKATITYEGIKYTPGELRIPKKGDHYINAWGNLGVAHIDRTHGEKSERRTILVPVVVEHVVGGVVFVDAGRHQPRKGEWAICGGAVYSFYVDSDYTYDIVRPVRLVEVDDDDGCCRDS